MRFMSVCVTAFMEEAFGDGYHNVYWHPVLDEIHKLKELYPAGKADVSKFDTHMWGKIFR